MEILPQQDSSGSISLFASATRAKTIAPTYLSEERREEQRFTLKSALWAILEKKDSILSNLDGFFLSLHQKQFLVKLLMTLIKTQNDKFFQSFNNLVVNLNQVPWVNKELVIFRTTFCDDSYDVVFHKWGVLYKRVSLVVFDIKSNKKKPFFVKIEPKIYHCLENKDLPPSYW